MAGPRLASLIKALRAGGATPGAARWRRLPGAASGQPPRRWPAFCATRSRRCGPGRRALSALGTEGVVPLLLEALEDAEADVRYWAAVALGNLASPSAVLALIRLARKDPVLEVREAAREAIPKTAW